jgi:hypothetical protein
MDWGSLVILSQVASPFQRLVVSEIRLRIRTFLSRFIPREAQANFWKKMEQTNGCIFGGVVRAIMMAGNDAYYDSFPPQLDIIIPLNTPAERSVWVWTTFLGSLGYTHVASPVQRNPFESCTRDIGYYTRPVHPFTLTLNRPLISCLLNPEP